MPDRVLVEPDLVKENEVLKSGLLIQRRLPKGLQGKPISGYIRFIGSAIEGFEIGQHVVFNDPDAHGFKHEGVRYIPLKADQLICIIDDSKALK